MLNNLKQKITDVVAWSGTHGRLVFGVVSCVLGALFLFRSRLFLTHFTLFCMGLFLIYTGLALLGFKTTTQHIDTFIRNLVKRFTRQ